MIKAIVLSTSLLLLAPAAKADVTAYPMNKAFDALQELLPSLAQKEKFEDKKNEAQIAAQLKQLDEAFALAKHSSTLKQDVFAPTLELIRKEIADSRSAFREGNKDYSWWRLRSVTAECLTCHTRLPKDLPSSFESGERFVDEKKFSRPFDLGMAQFLVRQYPQAKQSFTRAADEALVKKEYRDILPALRQLLAIELKIRKDPAQMLKIVDFYLAKPSIPKDDRATLQSWQKQLTERKRRPVKEALGNDQEFVSFMESFMKPLFKEQDLYVGARDVDLLLAAGLLSNFMVVNPESPKAPEAMYWLGLSEKYLERESFFSAGDAFLKNCVLRYPKHPVAKKCYEEYRESLIFNYSGSRGTDLPQDLEDELEVLRNRLKK